MISLAVKKASSYPQAVGIKAALNEEKVSFWLMLFAYALTIGSIWLFHSPDENHRFCQQFAAFFLSLLKNHTGKHSDS